MFSWGILHRDRQKRKTSAAPTRRVAVSLKSELKKKIAELEQRQLVIAKVQDLY